MALRPTTAEQVDGYRFVAQRARRAVVGQDIAARADRLRVQSRALGAGLALAGVVVAGAAVFGFVRPAPDLSTTEFVQVRETGALLVRVEETWHAVPNLASARLVLGRPESPRSVPERALVNVRRGPMVGIPGAPVGLPGDDAAREITWTVCDAALPERGSAVTLVVGETAAGRSDKDAGSGGLGGGGGRPNVRGDSDLPRGESPRGAWSPSTAVLAERDGQGWLVADGRRARIDLNDEVVLDVFGVRSWPRQRLSDAVLDTLPEAQPLHRVEVPGSGAPAPHGPAGMRIGEVFAVDSPAERKHFVVLSDGIQEVPALVAKLLRETGPSRDDPAPALLAPAQVTAPRTSSLEVSGLPVALPQRSQRNDPITCAWWRSDVAGDSAPRTGLLSAARVADVGIRVPVYLSSGDESGARLDAAIIPAGGMWLRPVGGGSEAQSGAERAIVTEVGVHHRVVDVEAAQALGVGGPAVPIPATILRRFPVGAELSLDAARVSFDVPHVDPADRQLGAN